MSDETFWMIVVGVLALLAYIGWLILKALFVGGAAAVSSISERRRLENEALRQQIIESQVRQIETVRAICHREGHDWEDGNMTGMQYCRRCDEEREDPDAVY